MMRVNYELSKSPATFDFANFLVRAEEERLNRGQDGISVRISFGLRKQSPRDVLFTQARKMWRINNLLIPLARCLPSVVDVAIGEGVQTLGYLPPNQPAKQVLKAPDSAVEIVERYLKDKPNPVSITLRRSDFEPQRNSEIEQWEMVARWLAVSGYTPIVVPDAEAELDGVREGDWKHLYPAAAISPEIRLALYERCVQNLMAAQGPMEVCLNSKAPVMVWKLEVPGLRMNSPEMLAVRGFKPGLHWGPGKYLYFEPDVAGEIIGRLETQLLQRKAA